MDFLSLGAAWLKPVNLFYSILLQFYYQSIYTFFDIVKINICWDMKYLTTDKKHVETQVEVSSFLKETCLLCCEERRTSIYITINVLFTSGYNASAHVLRICDSSYNVVCEKNRCTLSLQDWWWKCKMVVKSVFDFVHPKYLSKESWSFALSYWRLFVHRLIVRCDWVFASLWNACWCIFFIYVSLLYRNIMSTYIQGFCLASCSVD